MRKQQSTVAPEFLTVRSVAQFVETSERWVWDRLKDSVDPLPAVRLGPKLVRVRRADLIRWAESRRLTTDLDRLVAAAMGGVL